MTSASNCSAPPSARRAAVFRRGARAAGEADAPGLELQRASVREPGGDQILHQLLLAVDGGGFAAGERRKIEMDEAVAEADVERMVDHAVATHARAEPELMDQIDGALLEHAGAHARLDMLAAAGFEHHAVDALAIEQVRKEQPRRACADDPDLRAHLDVRPECGPSARRDA